MRFYFSSGVTHFFYFGMIGLEHKINEMARGIALAHGFELVEVRLSGGGKRMLLRVKIDKAGGVMLNDCELMSRDLEALLDLEDLIKGSYTLEVSSPGLDMPLKKPEDFKRNVGRLVRLVTYEKLDNQSFFIGRLVSVGQDSIRLLIDDRSLDILFGNISSARLEVEIK